MEADCGSVLVEAPLRVDFGGTIDIPEVASALAEEQPCTFNIAISPGVALEIGACPSGFNIVSGPISASVASRSGLVPPFGSPNRLVFGTLARLGADGVHVRIRPGCRPGSGLGGSGALTLALVFGLLALRGEGSQESPGFRMQCAILARNIEHDLGESITGLQDQLAAAFGGMNLWQWRIGSPNAPATQDALIGNKFLNEQLLVCELPFSRSSSIATRQFLQSLKTPTHRTTWSQLNSLTTTFADCVVRQDWREACLLSRTALTLRQALLAREDLLSHPVINEALRAGCAAGFGGGNVEGSVWAIGPIETIRQLGSWIRNTSNSGVRLLAMGIDLRGVRITALPPSPSPPVENE